VGGGDGGMGKGVLLSTSPLPPNFPHPLFSPTVATFTTPF